MKHFLLRNKENIIYGVIWTILFVSPIISMSVRTTINTDMSFNWHEIFNVWKVYSIFLGVFIIHNAFIAPLLVHKGKKRLYLIIVAILVTVFTVYQCAKKPKFPHHGPDGPHGPQQTEQIDRVPGGLPDWDKEGRAPGGPPEGDKDARMPAGDGNRPPRPPKHHNDMPPVILGQNDVINFFILIMMIGMNIGLKYYFKNQGDRKRLEELERKNLEQQLEYLKYQINPHFFMNTLNNIHALVDIDPKKAQTSILELSKMMRYVLYEGSEKMVPIQHEIRFINHYVTLMRLRYTDKVNININMPDNVEENKKLPPLLLVTFIENAFKHGVSYQNKSFIDITISIADNELLFTCRNSRFTDNEKNNKPGGVGLANAKKRLQLIYGDNHTLTIKDQDPDTYSVTLKLIIDN
ncbi:MAG: sensor histidine kinase [Prevotella sp.]|nr:sensor histidine kinase [Prevotella sp.]